MCRKDVGVLDESGSLQRIDSVMENQNDLVRVIHKFRQVLCVKG